MNYFLKLSCALSCLAAISPLAMAGDATKVGLQFRSAFEVNDSDDDSVLTSGLRANANNELESRKFNIQYAAMTFGGDVNEKVAYYIKLNFRNAYTATTDFGVSPAFNDAYATWTFNDQWKMNAGKMFLLPGGYEVYYNPSLQYYTTLAAKNVPFSSTGVRFNYKFNDQDLRFSLTNSGEEKNQQDPMVGALWMGSLLDGMITTNTSFFHKPRVKQSGSPSGVADASKRKDTYLALSAQGHLIDNKLTIEGQYGKNVHTKNTNNKDDSESSFHAKVSYRIEKFQPFVQFEVSEKEVADADYLDRTGYVAGLEYYPVENSNFRFHAVYWTMEDEYKTAVAATATAGAKTNGKKVETSQLLLGMNFSI